MILREDGRANLLDAIRYLIVWNPFILMAIQVLLRLLRTLLASLTVLYRASFTSSICSERLPVVRQRNERAFLPLTSLLLFLLWLGGKYGGRLLQHVFDAEGVNHLRA